LSGKPFNPAGGETCRETSGFLFSHPCEQIARYVCERCGKPICPQHVAYHEGRTLCIGCEKQAPTPEELKRPKIQDDSAYDDPYWYSRLYYETYSWHDNEFTEADESVLIHHDGEDVEWEKDMGAS